jgi:excisionase family DNA binding protein
MGLQTPESAPRSTPTPSPQAPADSGQGLELHELLTVEDVARLLKVSRSWVYEHTRSRGTARAERLPFIKIGKYKRFDPNAVREFLLRRSKIS